MASLPLLAALLLQQDVLLPHAPRLPLPVPSATAVAVVANDNRRAAGTMRRDTLVVELDVVEAAWRAEGPDDPVVRVLAFAERGRAPQVPAPLIRGRTGTPVRLILRSRVDSAIVVRNLRPGSDGALLVTDSARDLTRDHVIIAGGGPKVLAKQDSPFALVNGRVNPRPLRLVAGQTHRLRLVSINPQHIVHFTLTSDSTMARWRAVAKDGADLPPALAVASAAHTRLGPGETADYEFAPTTPGTWRMEVRSEQPGWFVPLEIVVTAPAAKP